VITASSLYAIRGLPGRAVCTCIHCIPIADCLLPNATNHSADRPHTTSEGGLEVSALPLPCRLLLTSDSPSDALAAEGTPSNEPPPPPPGGSSSGSSRPSQNFHQKKTRRRRVSSFSRERNLQRLPADESVPPPPVQNRTHWGSITPPPGCSMSPNGPPPPRIKSAAAHSPLLAVVAGRGLSDRVPCSAGNGGG
jgi:hypothetical protein